MRHSVCADRLIWDMDMAKVMQLIHADGIRNGVVYQWSNFFEPDQELLDEFDRLANPSELEDL